VSFDAVAEFGPSVALAAETDAEAMELLRELARVLRPGGRYLCGGATPAIAASSQASQDKRSLDEWRVEGAGTVHHTLRLMRRDGSWRRLHERIRIRGFDQVELLLGRAGFTILNAFEDYDQRRQAIAPRGDAILLCERS
jgi:hypothetical protein